MTGKDLLRWIAVLPTSAVAATLSFLLLMVIILIGDFLSGDLWIYLKYPQIFSVEHFFMSFILSAVFGYIFVYAGFTMSPKYKRATAFVLFAIIAAVVGFLMILTFITSHFTDSWRFLISSLICIIAAGVSAFSAEENCI